MKLKDILTEVKMGKDGKPDYSKANIVLKNQIQYLQRKSEKQKNDDKIADNRKLPDLSKVHVGNAVQDLMDEYEIGGWIEKDDEILDRLGRLGWF